MGIKNNKICLNCKSIYTDKNITTCFKCGIPTEDQVVEKGGDYETTLGEQFRPKGQRSRLYNTSKDVKGSARE